MRCILLLSFIAACACEGQVADTSLAADTVAASSDLVAASSDTVAAPFDSVAAPSDAVAASAESSPSAESAPSNVNENYGTYSSGYQSRWGRINGNYRDGGYRDGGYRDENNNDERINGNYRNGVITVNGDGLLYGGNENGDYRNNGYRDRGCGDDGCRNGGYGDNRGNIGFNENSVYNGKGYDMFFIPRLVGRQGLGFQKRNYFAAGMRFPITPQILEPIGTRPLIKELYFEPLQRYNYN